MRGLTREEHRFLTAAAVAAEVNCPDVDDTTIAALERRGLIRWEVVEERVTRWPVGDGTSDDWERTTTLRRCVATADGLLALRVCTVHG